MSYLIFIERSSHSPDWVHLEPEAAQECLDAVCAEAMASEPIQTVEFAENAGDIGSLARDNVIRVLVLKGEAVLPQPVTLVTRFELP
jgi:hypothetical protein